MINWKNTLENLMYIFVFAGLIALNNKYIVAPMFDSALKRETTAITQTVSQEIKNKFNVKKGGQVDANVSPVADPTQNNTIEKPILNTSSGVSEENCVDVSKLSESRRNRIKRWLGE